MTKQYQTITLAETHEELIVDVMEYPLQLAGIFYIKFIVYNKELDYVIHRQTDEKIYKYTPIKFITLLPQNILKRENEWSQEEMDMIQDAAQTAKDREKTMAEYRTAAEEEMKRRSKEIPPKSIIKNEDDDIDPDFKTEIDLTDPNYM